MAKHDVPDSDDNNGGKKGPGKFTGAILFVALAAIGYGLVVDDEPSEDGRSSKSGSFDPEQAQLEEEQQRQRIAELGREAVGQSSDTSNTDLDPYAAMSAMTRRQEMLEDRIKELTDEIEDAQGSNEELQALQGNYSRLEDQLRDLTELLMQEGELERETDRRATVSQNQSAGDDLAFDLEGGASADQIAGGADLPDFGDSIGSGTERPRQATRSKYGENYIVLNTAVSSGYESGGPSFSVSNPFEAGDGSSEETAEEGTGAASPRKNDVALSPEYSADVEAGYANAEPPEPGRPQDSKEASDSTLDIPAFSFVEAETLHGLDCPIGAALPRSSSNGGGDAAPTGVQPMPVVLPLRGEIRGPNGKVVNLGTAHLQGWCVGRRVDRGESGRAFIKIEAISYWDRHGKAQYLPDISGDVISLKDNHRGIQAPVDEVRRSYLGEQATAAAFASAATELSAAQFDETRNPDGGVDRVFNGNRGISYGARGASAAFEQVAALINEEAQSAFDAVRVSPGAPVKIMFMKPFEVTNHKLEVEDEVLDAYDILI